jgi:hypothetical protein
MHFEIDAFDRLEFAVALGKPGDLNDGIGNGWLLLPLNRSVACDLIESRRRRQVLISRNRMSAAALRL